MLEPTERSENVKGDHNFVACDWPNEHVCRACGIIPHTNHPNPKYRAAPARG